MWNGHVWNGELPVPLPIVPGHEPVGIIDSVGQGVKYVRLADRVGVSWFQAGCGRCPYFQMRRINRATGGRTRGGDRQTARAMEHS